MRAVSSGRNGARKTYSALCQRTFDSKTEARRGETLTTLERVGAISELQFQPMYLLNKSPRVSYRPDFQYREDGHLVLEDVKGGPITRELRVKLLWLREKFGLEVDLVRETRNGWEVERL
jgi:hypothetical protein